MKSEVRYGEINMTERLSLIPDERMKAGREHRIPLSDAAMAVLERMQENHVSAMYSPVSSKISCYRI